MPPAELPPPLPFAVTKIQPPDLRRDLVHRPRLEADLAAAMARCKVVVLLASAGFGKTVALATQVRRLQAEGAAVAWISSEEDDDLPRLAASIFAGLDAVDVPWRRSPDAIVAALDGADAARRRALAGEFVNALSATEIERGFMVLDDAHRLHDPRVFEFLAELIERLPRRWCIVVSTRLPLPFSTARWRLAGEFTEFEQESFRFDIDDVRALAEAHAPRDSSAQVEALLERTGGWAAGLCLALQPGAGRTPLADRHVFEYVATEVLSQMPEAKRTFLLRCSILPELSAARCEAVASDTEAARWLQELEVQGLFGVRRGHGAEAVLVLHDLFRDCLDHLLLRERGAELPELLKRAAALESDTLRRIGFLSRAAAWSEARTALLDAAPGMLTAGMVGPVLRLVEQLSASERHGPEVDMARGLAAWAQWDFSTMRNVMRRAALDCERAGDDVGRRWAQAHEAIALAAIHDSPATEQLVGRLLLEPLAGEALIAVRHAQAWLYSETGPLDDVCGLLESEYDEVERDPSPALWYKGAPNTRNYGLVGYQHLLERFIHGALDAATEGPSALRTLTTLMRAWLSIWAGDAQGADAALAQTVADAHWLGQSAVLDTQVWIARAFLAAMRGDAHAALDAIRRARESLRHLIDLNRRRFEHLFDSVELRIASSVGERSRVAEIAERLDRGGAQMRWGPPAAHGAALMGHAALARGDLREAENIWRGALAHDELLRMHGLDVELRVRVAALAARRGETADAADVLQPVFGRSTVEAIELPVMLAGAEAIDCLVTHDWGAALNFTESNRLQHWRRVSQALRDGARLAPVAQNNATADAFSDTDLTPRERDVLERLAAGDSNKVIARRLDISPYTVKRHVANLLEKLALSSRGQAAAWFNSRRV